MSYTIRFVQYLIQNQVSIATIFVTLYTFAFWWNRRNYVKLGDSFPGPFSYPLIGNLFEFYGPLKIDEIIKKIEDMCDRFKGTFRFWLFTKLFIVVTKAEDLEIVLKSQDCLEKDEFYDMYKKVLGDGLVTGRVNVWRDHRKMLAGSVGGVSVIRMLGNFKTKSYELVNKMKHLQDTMLLFDLWSFTSVISLGTICKNAMEYDLDDADEDAKKYRNIVPFADAVAYKRLVQPWLYPQFLFDIYTHVIGINYMYEHFDALPMKIINKKKVDFKDRHVAEVASRNSYGKLNSASFIETLLEKSNYSDAHIKDEVVTLLTAATDTTSCAICFTLLYLAMHPEYQAKAYEEMNEIFCENLDTLDDKTLPKLVYLEQCIKEALRLSTPIRFIARKTTGPVALSNGNVIPQGTSVLIPLGKIHRNPEIYPNPGVYNPDNFSLENVSKNHKFTFVPFSGGLRGCVGTRYAMTSLKVMLAHLLWNFYFKTTTRMEDIKIEMGTVIHKEGGWQFTIHARKNHNKETNTN